MKRILSVILSVLMLCSVFTGLDITAFGAEISDITVCEYSGDFEYVEYSDNTVEIVGYTGNSNVLNIPETINGLTVESIGEGAFFDKSTLISVKIPACVTNIVSNPFFGCNSLTSIVVDENNKKYDSRNNCNAIIESASGKLIAGCGGSVIPEGVEVICNSAFYCCPGLKSIVIPDGVETIEMKAFFLCENLNDITIPDSVTYIGTDSFYGTGYFENSDNWNNKMLYINNHLVGVKDSISGDCQIKEGTKTVVDSAFTCCQNLSSIVIPASLTKINNDMFSFCYSLRSVTIQGNIKSIGSSAFFECFALDTIELPDGIESIGNYAFNGCSVLKNLTIPDSVKSIGDDVFDYCFNLTIHCYKNTAAETYAKENNLKYNSVCKSHVPVADSGVEATCTKEGLTEGSHCSVCDEVLVTQEVIPATGHTEVIDEAVAPTCTETGLTEGKRCSVCNEVLVAQEEIPAIGYHTEVIDEAVVPTCGKVGLTEGKHCSVCNEVFVAQEEIPATGQHTETVDNAVAPSCTETGLTEGKHCSVCNEVFVAQKVIKATGHSTKVSGAKKATYFAKGHTGKTVCKTCGEVISKGKSILQLKLKTPTAKYTAGKKSFKVKYTKVKDATGFEVKYKIGKKAVTKTFSTKKSATKTIKNLKKGTYKVQIRAFVKSGSKTAYSAWTKAKSVKVK